MKTYITLQQTASRGTVLSLTVLNKRYPFNWNDKLKAYAIEVTDTDKANLLLRGLFGVRLYTPGIGILPDENTESAPVAIPAAPAATVAPVVQDNPEALEEPEVVVPVSEPVQEEVKIQRKRGRKMNKFIASIIAIIALTGLANAQLPSGTGSREPGSITREVELFVGCESKVVSFNGTAGTTLITSGKGLLMGVELISVSNGGTATAPTAPFPVRFFDKASKSQVSIASPSLGEAEKFIADQYLGPLCPAAQPVSVGGTFTASSLANTRNNMFRHPIKFDNGIVIDNDSTATSGQVNVYWTK